MRSEDEQKGKGNKRVETIRKNTDAHDTGCVKKGHVPLWPETQCGGQFHSRELGQRTLYAASRHLDFPLEAMRSH